MNNIVIATTKKWNIENTRRFALRNLKTKMFLVTDRNKLSYEKMRKISPRYIFFPHWSWTIPENIYNNFECVVFHMTDLPFGRGGSPLQNLILMGLTKTKLSSIKVTGELDAGPIYLKKNLSLRGSAEEIYKKASHIIFDSMIPYIMKNKPKPKPQKGEISVFNRRNQEDSKFPKNIDLASIYNYIRMLDAEDYPHAFIEMQNLRFKFTKAVKRDGFVEAKVHITTRGKK